MAFFNLFLLLAMGHFLGDFALQSDRMAQEKCAGTDPTLPWWIWLTAHGARARATRVHTDTRYTASETRRGPTLHILKQSSLVTQVPTALPRHEGRCTDGST